MMNSENREQKIESMDSNPFSVLHSLAWRSRGYTLIELVIAVGLFAVIMMLASGAYFMMISISRQTQGIATGIDNLSFAIETMTRTIRTGTNYSCNGGGNGNGNGSDCTSGGSTFHVVSSSGAGMDYALTNGVITQNGVALTDPSVTVTSLTFYAYGTGKPPADYHAPRVTFVVSGTVSSGPGKTEPFTVESGATMRGSDI